jgi:iron(II)-dependent oxidoreductase
MRHFDFFIALTAFYITVLSLSMINTLQAAGDNAIPTGDEAAMILLPGGKFIMGDEAGDLDEKPVHEIDIDSFYIDSHEVTVKQYKKFIEDKKHPKPAFWQPELDKPDDPVVGVSWQDAVDYALWAGKRLPTEAEWEYAARGGKLKGKYPWGDAAFAAFANYRSFGLLPVRSLKPNTYGIHDMIGNVWEWCADWYDSDYYSSSSSKNPKGPGIGTHKVLRGGAWYCDEREVRAGNRYYALPDAKSYNVGFRCVKSVK